MKQWNFLCATTVSLLACASNSDIDGKGLSADASFSAALDGGHLGLDASRSPTRSDSGFIFNSDGSMAGDYCGTSTINSGRVTPDILVVLDRSASMRTGPIDRWTPSVDGVKRVTAATEQYVNYGLMTFPRAGTSMVPLPAGGQTYSCEPGKIDVAVGAKNAGAIATALQTIGPGGATPTAATLAVAKMTLEQRPPDQYSNPAYVLLVTDGGPNCTNGVFDTSGAPQDTAAVEASVRTIAAMADESIETYVLAYGAKGDAVLRTALNRMAAAGGTGDTEYRPVDDGDAFVKELERITGKALSCDYKLAEPAQDARYVSVSFDGTRPPYSASEGFTLSKDGVLLSFHGSYCDALLAGSTHTIKVQVECEIVNILL